MANILQFDGGKLLRAHSSVIQTNYSTRLINADIDAVILESLKGPVELDTDVDNSFYNFENSWVSSANSDYIEYGDRLYYSRAIGRPEKFDGVDTFNLGIDAPIATPAVNAEGTPLSDDSGPIEGIILTNRAIVDADLETEFETFTDADATLVNGDKAPGFSDGPQFYRVCLIDGNDIVHTKEVRIDVDASEGNLVRIILNNLEGHRIRIYRAINTNGTLVYRFFNENLIALDSQDYIDYGINLADRDAYVEPQTSNKSSTIQYTVTYYNASDGTESAPMEFTPEFRTTPDQAVVLTNIPVSPDPQVTDKNIYRLGGELVIMSRVAQIRNAITEYNDLISDLDIGEVLDSVGNIPPDLDLTSLVEAHGIFFGLVENELRFSEIDQPNYWPPENSFRLRGRGTGLLVTLQGVLVFTDTITYLLEGNNISNFALGLLSDKQGCVSHKSCQLIEERPLWISYEGVCTLINLSVQVLSKSFLDTVEIPVHQTEVFDEQYYIVLTDGTISVVELKGDPRFYDIKVLKEVPKEAGEEGETESVIRKITGIRRHRDKLYFAIDGRLHEAFAGPQLKLEYTSPVLTDGNHSKVKYYNKIYIRYNGVFTIKMHIDEKLVQTCEVDSEGDDDTVDYRPPVGNQRGFSCRFDIEGTGRIYSIETLPTERESDA